MPLKTTSQGEAGTVQAREIDSNTNYDLKSEPDSQTLQYCNHKKFVTSLGPNIRSRRTSAAVRMHKNSIAQKHNLTQKLKEKRLSSITHGSKPLLSGNQGYTEAKILKIKDFECENSALNIS